jgi:hypothetical protein
VLVCLHVHLIANPDHGSFRLEPAFPAIAGADAKDLGQMGTP